MPRITEATVAAHRVAQLTRLMDAAHEIAEEGGAEAGEDGAPLEDELEVQAGEDDDEGGGA